MGSYCGCHPRHGYLGVTPIGPAGIGFQVNVLIPAHLRSFSLTACGIGGCLIHSCSGARVTHLESLGWGRLEIQVNKRGTKAPSPAPIL